MVSEAIIRSSTDWNTQQIDLIWMETHNNNINYFIECIGHGSVDFSHSSIFLTPLFIHLFTKYVLNLCCEASIILGSVYKGKRTSVSLRSLTVKWRETTINQISAENYNKYYSEKLWEAGMYAWSVWTNLW